MSGNKTNKKKNKMAAKCTYTCTSIIMLYIMYIISMYCSWISSVSITVLPCDCMLVYIEHNIHVARSGYYFLGLVKIYHSKKKKHAIGYI